MQVKYLAGIVGAALLLAGCSSSNELTSAGQNVRFVQEKPGAECQLLGTATGKQSNWLSVYLEIHLLKYLLYIVH